jgi:hypothetical protein
MKRGSSHSNTFLQKPVLRGERLGQDNEFTKTSTALSDFFALRSETRSAILQMHAYAHTIAYVRERKAEALMHEHTIFLSALICMQI